MDGSGGRPARRPTLSAFEGRWSVDRRIEHADGLSGRFTGQATFTRSGPECLLLEETGTLSQGGREMHAERRYLWRTTPHGEIAISFADNRPFHVLAPGTARPDAVYLCPPDRYAVAYDFTDWPVWRTVWRVEGPRKNYRMETQFRRID